MIRSNVFVSNDETSTLEYASSLAKQFLPGDFVALYGDLGAGKTAFTKGIAKGLNIKDEILSPTYTFLRIYNGDLPLYHFDVYRITDIDELSEIDFEEYAYANGVCVCEWANLISEVLPQNRYDIKIEYLQDGYRQITLNKLTQDK